MRQEVGTSGERNREEGGSSEGKNGKDWGKGCGGVGEEMENRAFPSVKQK